MSRLDPGLRRTQRWMQSAILTTGPVERALAGEASEAVPFEQAGRMILPSKTLQPLERLDIYRDMYLARLGDALEADYPLLRAYLGEARWDHLVERYLARHPSRSYTLNRLGDALPAFLARLRSWPDRGFVADLARAELAMTEVVDAVEAAPLGPEAIAAIPPEAWERARLRPAPAFRLLALRYPVNAWASAIWDAAPRPRLGRRNTWLALSRRNYRLVRTELTRTGYAILRALIAGRTLGSSIGRRRVRRRELFRWFRDWVAAGMFASVEY
jgi:hypothetical protein